MIISTKWVYRNKLDESGNVVRNKARLVAKGYSQQEGIDIIETFVPVARIEAIRILLAFTACTSMVVFLYSVNTATISISKNLFLHSRTKHDLPHIGLTYRRTGWHMTSAMPLPTAWEIR
uniref:Copia protein n=1 Tax=Cajanus cajan TaxID=3821 RepID=A0A151RCG0_CAJCA|nr:Copia protein [Cajanus cajan]